MAIYQIGELSPDLHPSAWVADSAQVMGQVTMAEDSSGMLISMRFEIRVLVFTEEGMMSDSPGKRSTSS